MLGFKSAVEEKLRAANADVYKHSQELVIRNKTLSLLRRLYQISIRSLNRLSLSEEITKDIRESLDLELVGILTYEAQSDELVPLFFSVSNRVSLTNINNANLVDTLKIQHASQVPFLEKVFKGSAQNTSSVQDIWGSSVHTQELSKIAEAGHIREAIVHPLSGEENLQGILVLGLNRAAADLSQFELESISSLVDVVSVALDRARLYEELNKANEQQVVLIHFITHQIKGFVAKSRNIFSMALEGDFGPVSPELKPMLQAGFESDTKGANTISEILNAANIKSGKVSYAMAPFDLKQLIEEVAKDLETGAKAKKLVLTLNLGNEPLMVTGDRAQLINVFKNLIDNSIKYTPQGEVHVSLTKKDGKVLFEISDNGVGITPEDMKNLFTEGGHGKDSSKVNVESTGFGLYIVKSIIDAHQGRVWATSEGAGKGSHFFVELPV